MKNHSFLLPQVSIKMDKSHKCVTFVRKSHYTKMTKKIIPRLKLGAKWVTEIWGE